MGTIWSLEYLKLFLVYSYQLYNLYQLLGFLQILSFIMMSRDILSRLNAAYYCCEILTVVAEARTGRAARRRGVPLWSPSRCRSCCTAAASRPTTAAPRRNMTQAELETKVKRRFTKISQSRRRPLLGPSPGYCGVNVRLA